MTNSTTSRAWPETPEALDALTQLEMMALEAAQRRREKHEEVRRQEEELQRANKAREQSVKQSGRQRSRNAKRRRQYVPVHTQAAAAETNDKFFLVDKRTRWARRWRDLVISYTSELGGDASLKESQRSIIRRIATLSVELEAAESRFASKAATQSDIDEYQRHASGMRRLMEALGLVDVTFIRDPSEHTRIINRICGMPQNRIRRLLADTERLRTVLLSMVTEIDSGKISDEDAKATISVAEATFNILTADASGDDKTITFSDPHE